uniref:Extracellular matrix protein 1b n=1 Tax=Gadus morhua TaxID=8049 RepID=A0A8C4Z954_GADMO
MDWSWTLVCACAGLFWIGRASGGKRASFVYLIDFKFLTGNVSLARTLIDFNDHKFLQNIPLAGPPAFGPRSFGMPPPSLNYPVVFPPGRPMPNNLQAICLHGDHRPRYPDTYFPASGFGQLKRRALAVNLAESLFSECCAADQTRGQNLTLCCVKQAWKQMVATFCEMDTSVKDRVYSCCKEQGSAQLKCFQEDAPNASYLPTEELPVSPIPVESSFSFSPDTCLSNAPLRCTEAVPLSISFPPARPMADDIKSVCIHHKLRPFYDLRCLPRRGYGWLVRQTKAVNRLERGFKQCCKRKQEVLECADGKWREEMDRFCREDKERKMKYHCCEMEEGQERYECFHSSSPSAGYNVDLSTYTPTLQNASLGQICETHKLIKKKLLAGLPIQNFVKQCCHLSSNQRTSCIQQKVSICSTRKAPFVAKCCITSVDSTKCISKILMNAISKQIKIDQRTKKCPLS